MQLRDFQIIFCFLYWGGGRFPWMTMWMAQKKEKRFTYEVKNREMPSSLNSSRSEDISCKFSMCFFFSLSTLTLFTVAESRDFDYETSLVEREREEESRSFNSFSQAITSFDSINYSLWGWLQMNLNRPSWADSIATREEKEIQKLTSSTMERKKGLSARNIFRWKRRIESWKSFQSILRCTTFSTTKHITTEKRLSSNDRPRPVELSFAIQQRRRKKKVSRKFEIFRVGRQ